MAIKGGKTEAGMENIGTRKTSMHHRWGYHTKRILNRKIKKKLREGKRNHSGNKTY